MIILTLPTEQIQRQLAIILLKILCLPLFCIKYKQSYNSICCFTQVCNCHHMRNDIKGISGLKNLRKRGTGK
jgi:hypothetical protein